MDFCELKVLSSGSQGNCYLLRCPSETLILELGVNWDEVLLNLDFNISDVVGVCVSHSHG